jgi:uncharacterized ParB-like nuclease family protein
MFMMSYTPQVLLRQEAVSEFERAQRRAKRHLLRAKVFGQPKHLLCLNSFRYHTHSLKRLEDIPLSKVVGSLGRCQDFSSDFLPKHRGLEERWTRVWQLMREMKTLPPIEVYQMNDLYFVLDGHHRVSVAKQLGLSHIEAHVSELKELSPTQS